MSSSAAYGSVGAQLPIAAFRSEIVASIARNTVTIVKGDTGSGKSSQLPQYILHTSALAAAASKRAASPNDPKAPPSTVVIPHELWGVRSPNIYVTQPRRVAAVTLAKRVSDELGESTVGGVVGYRIGHDAVASERTRITFCTTGWLLQWLVHAEADVAAQQASPTTGTTGATSREREGLGNVTHIILDEVHERGMDTDLVCLVIKLALGRAFAARARAITALAAASKSGGSDAMLRAAAEKALCEFASRPRVVLMSATFDTTLFTDYFTACGVEFAGALARGSADHFSHPLFDMPLSKAMPSLTAMIARPPAVAIAGTLGELLRNDAPHTLYVGAKRYPVAEVFLESVYSEPSLKEKLARSETQQVASACASFNKAAADWAGKQARSGGGGGIPQRRPLQNTASASTAAGSSPGAPPEGAAGPSVVGGVADALTLPDTQATAVLRLAARIAIAVARPGGGDCVSRSITTSYS